MDAQKTGVVIIGAGPTGLSLAAQLLRHKIDFIILERNETITHLSKAIAVQARTLEIFKEFGIAEEAVKRGRITTGMKLFYKGRQKLSIDLAGLGKGLSEFSFALSLEQSKTEQLLVDDLKNHGKEVQWKSEFLRFEEDHNGVTVYYKDGQDGEKKIEGAYLVGCDGAGSAVRHQLNLSFEGSTEPKLFYVADVSIQSEIINEDVLYMYMIPKGFTLFFPMEGKGHYRLIGILPDHETSGQYRFSDIEEEIKQSILTPLNFEKLHWFSTYKVHSRKAASFMRGRCFIAGDAAHIHTPAGGQGMNTGIQDAYNLAWKLAAVIRGELNETVLKTYDTERSSNAGRLLKTTDRMFDIMSGVNPFWNFIRLKFFAPFLSSLTKSNLVRKNIFPLLSQTGIAYPGSELTITSSIGNVKAGDRMHYFVLANGRSVFSYVKEPVFKLLYFGNNAPALPAPLPVETDFLSFNEIPGSLFGKARDFYILLRPDNHISYIGKEFTKCRELIDRFSAQGS